MPSGNIGITTTNGYISGRVYWEERNVNQAANTSDVYMEMHLQRTNTGYTTSGSGTFTVNTNNTDINNTESFSITYNSDTLMVAGTIYNIPHNADGTKQVYIVWGGTSNVFNVNGGNQLVTLTQINRQSVLSSPVPPNITAGNDIPFTITQYMANVHHSVLMYVQHKNDSNWDLIKQIDNQGTSGTISLTLADNTQVFTTLQQRASANVLIRVRTYDSGNNEINGDQDNVGTISAPAVTIPTLPNFNIGDTVGITLNGANINFLHDLTVNFGGYSRQLASKVNGVWQWNTALNGDNNGMYQQIPNAQAGVGSITCTTFFNGVQVQSPVGSALFTATVTNSNPTFSTINYLDNNSTYSTLTGNNQYIIQNKSDLLAKVLDANKATPKNYATLSKYIATFNNVSIQVTSWSAGVDILFDFGAVNVSSNQNLTITAYDSRGFTTTITLSVNIVPYAPPVVNTTATRGSGFTSTVTITLAGTISPLLVGASNKNSLKAANTTYASGQVGSGLGAATPFTGQTLTMPNYSAAYPTITCATTNAWNVQIIVTDQISSTTVNLVVPVGIPIMFIDKIMKAIGIGKFPRSGYSIDAASDISTDTKFVEAGSTIQDKYAPSGSLVMYGGQTAPAGWLIADGSAVSRTTYAKLFGVIGSVYGAGDGSTTFNLPNMAGRMPVGLYSADGTMNVLGKTGGESTHTLAANEMPAHSHQTVWVGGYSAFGGAGGNPAQGAGYGTDLSNLSTGSAGGGAAHNNMPPFSVVYFIIKT